jgi:hypothetical protein
LACIGDFTRRQNPDEYHHPHLHKNFKSHIFSVRLARLGANIQAQDLQIRSGIASRYSGTWVSWVVSSGGCWRFLVHGTVKQQLVLRGHCTVGPISDISNTEITYLGLCDIKIEQTSLNIELW